MADALASGASEGNLVGVQVPPRPPSTAGNGQPGEAQQVAASSRVPLVGVGAAPLEDLGRSDSFVRTATRP